jgi:hypothetical protein
VSASVLGGLEIRLETTASAPRASELCRTALCLWRGIDPVQHLARVVVPNIEPPWRFGRKIFYALPGSRQVHERFDQVWFVAGRNFVNVKRF